LISSPPSTAYPNRRFGRTGKSARSGCTPFLISSQLELRDLSQQRDTIIHRADGGLVVRLVLILHVKGTGDQIVCPPKIPPYFFSRLLARLVESVASNVAEFRGLAVEDPHHVPAVHNLYELYQEKRWLYGVWGKKNSCQWRV
jgi:hypothetical protein